MIMLISPAKQMRSLPDDMEPRSAPRFARESQLLLLRLRELSFSQLREVLKCSDRLARQAFEWIQQAQPDRDPATPAILSYVGIQYQYMLPGAFTDCQLEYLQEHLRILSGFYGLLRPLDGILPYRLEMQAKVSVDGCKNLYEFWGDSLARALDEEGDGVFLNLASEEYARAVRPYLSPSVRWITPVFGQLEGGKVKEKGVYVKMARGEMVRFLTEAMAQGPEVALEFSRLGFRYSPRLSSPNSPVFLMEEPRPSC